MTLRQPGLRAFAQSIVESVRHPLLILDGDLRVWTANRPFYHVFSTDPAATEGRCVFELGRRQWDIPSLRDRLQQVITSNTTFEDFELDHEFEGVGRKSLLLNGRQVYREDDRTPMVLLAVEDVTELRRLNAELEVRVRRRTAELENANRELEAFCYSVSHDLSAPLRAIDGFSLELLQTYADRLDDQGRHYLQRVRSGSQRMAQLIDDLLKLSRVSRSDMHRQPVDLSALAAVVVAELARRSPDRSVRFVIQPGLHAAEDAGLLRIVLDNLFDNAWKFTSRHPQATIEFGQTVHESQPVYFVRDDGAGFDMRYAAKLFGAFQRLHKEREFPGTGIGLATVQRVIHRHGGRVWADAAIEKGATFYFTLPEGADS